MTDPQKPPAATADQPPPESPPAVVVSRWIQLVMLPLALVALFALARAAKSVVLLFMVASVVALMLNPLVTLLHRARLPRGLAVTAVYLAFFAALAGVGVLLANPISHQINAFQHDVPHLTAQANRGLASLQRFLDRNGVGLQVSKQGQTALDTLRNKLVHSSGSIVSFTGNVLTKVATGAFGLLLILVISIYMLVYGERIGRLVRSVLPAGDGSPQDDLPVCAQRAVFSYVRGQILFSLVMATSIALGLWLLGITGVFPDGRRYAIAFGAFYGLMEAVPYVGAVLGALPPIILALFTDPVSAIWVGLLFVVMQQLEGHVVAPQIFGHSLRLNPLLVIFALLIGESLYGIIGALLALPVAAVVRETIVYMRRHLVLESWNTPSVAALAGAGLALGEGPAAHRAAGTDAADGPDPDRPPPQETGAPSGSDELLLRAPGRGPGEREADEIDARRDALPGDSASTSEAPAATGRGRSGGPLRDE